MILMMTILKAIRMSIAVIVMIAAYYDYDN